MTTDVATEQVLVIPTSVFHRLGHFNGFRVERAGDLDELLNPSHTAYRPRSEMEEDPSFKQLIPYAIFYRTLPDGSREVFQYLRGKGQGEKRLHAKRSVGIGGHISTLDTADDNAAVYEAGFRRELDEEVVYTGTVHEQRVGLINDDETPVGRVHLGVVHMMELIDGDVQPREAEMLESGFVPAADLLTRVDEFETWSKYALQALFG